MQSGRGYRLTGDPLSVRIGDGDGGSHMFRDPSTDDYLLLTEDVPEQKGIVISRHLKVIPLVSSLALPHIERVSE